MIKPKESLPTNFYRAVLKLRLSDYVRLCAAQIIGAGGPLAHADGGKNIYPMRTDLRIPHKQFDPVLGRIVKTMVRVRVTVEVEGWEPME